MDKNTIDKLMKLQNGLNEYITPKWKNIRTELDFMIASHQEMSELIDTTITKNNKKYSLNWKWWKDNNSLNKTTSSINWDKLDEDVKNNIKIELTDLLFFTLSQKCLNDFTNEIETVELNINDWVNFMSISANNLLQRPGAALMLILSLSKKINFNILAYYCAKLTLNLIRQDSGYKNGTYTKVKDGVEDNVLLHNIVKNITYDEMVSNFETKCDEIMKETYKKFGMENNENNFNYQKLTNL